VLDDTFGAAWDPYCAAAQPAGSAWRCFHAQYWPAATTVGAVPTLFLEYLYDLANVCASSRLPKTRRNIRTHLNTSTSGSDAWLK